jgi:hypothetical protein
MWTRLYGVILFGLFDDDLCDSGYKSLNILMVVNDELERIWKEAVAVLLMFYSSTCKQWRSTFTQDCR